MAAENELYNLNKVLEVYEGLVEIKELYGNLGWKYPNDILEKYGKLTPLKKEIFKSYYFDYKKQFFCTISGYSEKLKSLSIDNKTKDDIIGRLEKISTLYTQKPFSSADNDNEIKKIPYIRNSINKLMKFLKAHKLYNKEDEYFSQWIEEYIGYIIVYLNNLNDCIALTHYKIKKHADLDFTSEDWEKIHVAYDNGDFIETYFNLEKLVSKVTYLDAPLPEVKQLLEKYGYSK